MKQATTNEETKRQHLNRNLDEIRNQESDLDEEFTLCDPLAVIPEGQYLALCFGYQKSDYRSFEKLTFNYRIVEGDYSGIELNMYCNGRNKRGMFHELSKFYQSWVVANYGKKPARNCISPRKLIGGIFHVSVRFATPLHYDGTDLPDSMSYSVIDHLIERLPDDRN